MIGAIHHALRSRMNMMNSLMMPVRLAITARNLPLFLSRRAASAALGEKGYPSLGREAKSIRVWR